MLDLPFFDRGHAELAARLDAYARDQVAPLAERAERGDLVAAGRAFIASAAAADVLQVFVGDGRSALSLRQLCLARERIAAHSGFADSVLAVSGLGSYPIYLAGSDDLKASYAEPAGDGDAIGAFALTEPNAGSDPAGIETTARRDGDRYRISGAKTFISNAGLASFYVVFAKTDAAAGAKGLSAFVVDADAPGLRVARQIELLAPHPLGELQFDECRVAASHRLGREGEGLKIALRTLDFFRASVGAAACGMGARALSEATVYASGRQQFGQAIADFQATKMAIADMATELDAARLLVYRSAWLKDSGAARVTREASMAKLFATEAAQRIVDRAVQIHGGKGVVRGSVVERLYREVRALRIYEGTSEIQRLVIANQLLHRDAT